MRFGELCLNCQDEYQRLREEIEATEAGLPEETNPFQDDPGLAEFVPVRKVAA